jgi:hypothetical protein
MDETPEGARTVILTEDLSFMINSRYGRVLSMAVFRGEYILIAFERGLIKLWEDGAEHMAAEPRIGTAAYNAVNERHIVDPQVGDYWQEMFCPYFVVLDRVTENQVLICEKTKPAGPNHWTWDLDNLSLRTLEELRKKVSYSCIPGFVADVFPGAHKWAAEAAKK